MLRNWCVPHDQGPARTAEFYRGPYLARHGILYAAGGHSIGSVKLAGLDLVPAQQACALTLASSWDLHIAPGSAR